MKHTFYFDHIDCANCAAKIERALQKEEVFKEVSINFMLKKIEIVTEENESSTKAYVEQIAKKIENEVIILSHEKHEHKDEHKDEHKHEHEHEHNMENGCSCGGNHDKCKGNHASLHQNYIAVKEKYFSHNKMVLIRIMTSLVLLLICRQIDFLPLYIATYLLIGYDVLLKAARNLTKGKVFDENFLMALATVAAFFIQEYPEAIAVMLFYQIGEYFQYRAVDSSRKAIVELMDIRPEFARVIGDKDEKVSPQDVKINQIIEVRPGEKVPLDGVVIKGNSYLDTAMLTGESIPQNIKEGMPILSGSINTDSVIQIRVTKDFGESTVSKIVELIENASSKKSVAESLITKFAAVYTPLVVIMAILVAVIPSLLTGDWNQWLYNSISFLVISCPCALVVSIPLSFFGGIGAASKKGILVKGANYLEKLNEIDTVVLDKTGTITEGQFGVSHLLPAEGYTEKELLTYGGKIEVYSNHPIAKSIVAHIGGIEKTEVKDYKEVAGYGLIATLEGKKVLAGNFKHMMQNNIEVEEVQEIGTPIYVAVDEKYLGCIIVADKIKKDSKEAITHMKLQGIKEVIMLTGDKKEVAEAIGKEVGVDKVYAQLLPQDKVMRVEELIKQGKKVAFIGDGINDAPVLARADLGIAMGGVGSDAAVEASDMVLMTDELSCINKALEIAKKTKTIVTQNIVLAIGIKLLVMVLALMSIANMWMAVFADVGVSLLAVLNATRILIDSKKDARS